MADVQTFLGELSEALSATHQTEAKFDRFAKMVLAGTGDNPEERKALCKRVAGFSKVLQQLVNRTKGNHPYGFARLDAFGSILNEVCETSLDQPENHYPADAPASFPFLWDTPRLDWVQWNGSIDSPIARNVGEVLGVFGQLRLKPDPAEGQFTSTAHLRNLFELEQLVDQLTAPKWPRRILGAIDWVDATAGERLYAENCAMCHAVRDGQGKFPLTPANALGKEFIQTNMIALDKIGTDPQLARNFTDRVAVASFLKPLLPAELQAAPKIPRRVLLSVAVAKVVERKIIESQPPLDREQLTRLNGFRMRGEQPPNLAAYKARPLNGVWATSPFLHNGSVPNLDALLRPGKDRPKSFWVGSRSFDVDRVGFSSEESDGASHFQVVDDEGKPIPGNSNAGHEGKYYTQRRGEDGTWRDFTADERQELIEYMKSLR
jgi:mono/diheme cytochrome c family protein